MLQEILKTKPSHWDWDETMFHEPYAKIGLQSESDEYKQVREKIFPSLQSNKIRKIHRIQHAFAYANYQLKMMHNSVKSGFTNYLEETVIKKFDNESIADKFITSNCDERTVQNISTFYGTYCVIYKRGLSDSKLKYPEYLVEIENTKNETLSYLMSNLRVGEYCP